MTDPSPGNVLDDPCVRRVAAALTSFGVRGQITVLNDSARTARQAADALGNEIAQIANSLVFRAYRNDETNRPLLVLASGAHKVDTLRVADLLELRAISLADADFVSEHTGFTIGGVAPIAPSHPLETVVDVSLSRYDQVWAAAGHPPAVPDVLRRAAETHRRPPRRSCLTTPGRPVTVAAITVATRSPWPPDHRGHPITVATRFRADSALYGL
jgi:prolyl-tRNA editing enzyme YbaK/EbsC (Cys-tRNA(Pro) deacylase)